MWKLEGRDVYVYRGSSINPATLCFRKNFLAQKIETRNFSVSQDDETHNLLI